jgi:hypothetical protein
MSRAVKWTIATTVALIAIAAPAGAASAASLTVTAPSTIKVNKRFNVVASGKGTFAHNYIALFISGTKCKGTYAAQSNGFRLRPFKAGFVPKSFKVTMLKNVFSSKPVTLWFCTYLYPKASGSAWAFKPPEAKNSHRIKFT